MNNGKFIIHNSTKHYNDYEVFEFILECLGKGLLSNNNTEYCYCIVRQCEKWDLVFVSNKTKTGYRFDVYENSKESKGDEQDMNNCVICNKEIKSDSQFIKGNWYHNDCIENLQRELEYYKQGYERIVNQYHDMKIEFEKYEPYFRGIDAIKDLESKGE